MQTPTKKVLLISIFSIGVMVLLFARGSGEKEIILRKNSAEIENVIKSGTEPTIQTTASNSPAEENKITLNAAGAYLLDSGEPLYIFRGEKRWPIASVTKLMTALVARRVISEAEIVTLNEEAVGAPGEAGDFKAGERFVASDLVKAMLISSSNDAAQALAAYYGEEEFVARMNETAAEAELNETTFSDPAGLSTKNLSTIGNLEKLVRFVWNEDPEIFELTRLPTVSILDIDNGRSRKLYNINPFASRKNFLGGKTGYLPSSDGNLISIFSLPRYSSPVVIIVLGADDRFKETERILMRL